MTTTSPRWTAFRVYGREKTTVSQQRWNPDELELVRRVAELKNMTLSEFIVTAAVIAAEEWRESHPELEEELDKRRTS